VLALRSDASTVDEYLADLPDGRAAAIGTVRDALTAVIDPGFDESMRWGMITYEVPLSIHPDTYNGQPLMFAALASQKRHMSLYLTTIYADEESRADFVGRAKDAGFRLDMGKSCIRFRRIEDLPLDLIAGELGRWDVPSFVEMAETARRR